MSDRKNEKVEVVVSGQLTYCFNRKLIMTRKEAKELERKIDCSTFEQIDELADNLGFGYVDYSGGEIDDFFIREIAEDE